MNAHIRKAQPTSKAFVYILIALAAMMVIYLTVNIGNVNPARVSLLSLPEHTTQGDTHAPIPVPTAPVAQNQATVTPAPAVAVQLAPVQVPQPVPTPPASH